MSADEALFDGHPVAHVVDFRERRRLARKLEEAQRAVRAEKSRRLAAERGPLGGRIW